MGGNSPVIWGPNQTGIVLPANGLTGDDIDIKGITIDGGGSAITTGVKGYIYFPFACAIRSVTLLADQTGSCVIDIWKLAYSTSYPPLVANTITASAKPTLSTQKNSQDTSLSGWSKTIAVGDVLAFNVDSATTITRVTLTLEILK